MTSPNFPSNYGDGQACSIRANANGELRVDSFETEAEYDKLTIGAKKYDGSSGPVGVSIDPATAISWDSDADTNKPGWKICLGAW